MDISMVKSIDSSFRQKADVLLERLGDMGDRLRSPHLVHNEIMRTLMAEHSQMLRDLLEGISSEVDFLDEALLREAISTLEQGSNVREILQLLISRGVGTAVPIEDFQQAIQRRSWGATTSASVHSAKYTLHKIHGGFDIIFLHDAQTGQGGRRIREVTLVRKKR